MATVLEQEVEGRLPSDQECFDFVPPECCLGDKVHFWAKGKADPKVRPEVGIIVERPTTRKTITVHLLHTGVNKTTVRHVSDPNLVRRPNLRDQGAWDFMQTDKELIEWRKGIDEKLALLELKLDQIEAVERRLHSLAVKVGHLKGKAESPETSE